MNKELDAFSMAGKLLGRRGMSLDELYEALLAHEVLPHEAAQACQRMQEMGYADDDEYARSLTARYTARAYGLYAIRAKLQAHSLDRQVIQKALEDWQPDESSLNRIVHMKLRGNFDSDSIRKTVASLIRRGFTISQAKDAVQRYIQENKEANENEEDNGSEST